MSTMLTHKPPKNTTMSRKFHSLFPPNTSIKDFGYENDHPLRNGTFSKEYMYDGIDIAGMSTLESEDDYEEEDLAGITTQTELSTNDDDEINRKAIALFDFTPENDNEVGLTEGQIIWISYRHGQGWLVAEDPESGENGLVPEEYVEIYYDKQEIIEDIPKPFLPELFQYGNSRDNNEEIDESEWEDTDYEVEEENGKLNEVMNDMKKL
jgi:hypothetical protein